MTFRSLPLTLAVASLSAVASAQATEAAAAQALGLDHADVVSVGLAGVPGQPSTAWLELDGALQQMVLTPVSVRSDKFELVIHEGGDQYTTAFADTPVTYRGEIIGMPGAQVAASWLDDGLHAMVLDVDGSALWIEPLAGHVAGGAPADHVVYRSSDVSASYGQCGVGDDDDHLRIAGESANQASNFDSPNVAYGGTLLIAELGIDTDFEYFQDYGTSQATQNQIESVINTMNLQYESEVNITHEITTIIVRTSSNDPYTTTSSGTFLDQFRNHWNSQQQGVQRDTAHLFTGKNLSGSVIGIAYLGVICNNSFGYGIVESDCCGSFASKTDLSAHELGHNWNADHCNCSGFTMNSFLTSANQFSPSATIPAMINYSNNQNCLGSGPGGGDCVADQYGAGISPGNIGTFTSSVDPLIGTNWSGAFSGFNGPAGGLFVASVQEAAIPFGQATILVNSANQLTQVPVSANGSGSGSVTVPVPNNPALVGFQVFCQIGILDSSFGAAYALSNGLELVFCN